MSHNVSVTRKPATPFGQYVRQLRSCGDYATFAEGIDVSTAYLSQVETGKKPPSPYMIQAIINYFNLDAEEQKNLYRLADQETRIFRIQPQTPLGREIVGMISRFADVLTDEQVAQICSIMEAPKPKEVEMSSVPYQYGGGAS